MLVHRIEHMETGQGPFSSGGAIVHSCPHTGHSPGLMPMPNNDGIEHVDDDDYFGFTSLDDLRRVFGPYQCSQGAVDGFAYVVYEVEPSKVKVGRSQCCFKRADAKEVECVSTMALAI